MPSKKIPSTAARQFSVIQDTAWIISWLRNPHAMYWNFCHIHPDAFAWAPDAIIGLFLIIGFNVDKNIQLIFIAGFLAFVFIGCSWKHLILNDDNTLELSGCSILPNCAASTTWILYNRTPSFDPAIPDDEAWVKVKDVIRQMPRTEIVEEDDVYVHAKCTSRVFRFVDNLELLRHPGENRISVRSSSFIAIWDLFANHWRVFKLRRELQEMELIR